MNTQKKTNLTSEIETINAMYGKLPPQAIEVEEAVLGALMLEESAIYTIAGIIGEESFYKSEHQIIFKAITDVSESKQKIDLLTVTQNLKDNNLLEQIGGPAYITTLTRRVAAAAHIEQHARIIAEKYLSRTLISKFTSCINRAYMDDVDELEIEYFETTQVIDSLFAGKTGMKHISTILDETRKDLEIREQKALVGEIQGVNTGLTELNELTNGWQPGDLIVIGARPSMGKTAVAVNLFTKSAAIKEFKVCYFSLEMADLKLSKRLILSYGGINRYNYERGKMTKEEWNAFNEADQNLRRLGIYIDDTPGPTIRHIGSIINTKVRKGQCDIAIIDYLQLIETPQGFSNKNREREVAETSRGLKKVAKACNIPIILLAQLNRDLENRENKTPRLSDLRESGAIENDADMVIFPWRPAYYDPSAVSDSGQSMINVILFEVSKNRDGKLATIYSKHNDDLTQFHDFNLKAIQSPIF